MATLLVITGICLVVLGAILPFVLVLIPEVTGLVVLNFFTGNLRGIGPGLHFKFPWEIVRKENFFSLELVTRGVEETYAAADGPQMKVRWSIQYRPDGRNLTQYITVDKTTIERGFSDVISSALSSVIGGKQAEEARTQIKEIEKTVLEALEVEQMKSHGANTSAKGKLEEEYGINFVLFKIADIDFSDDYQQARAGKARMQAIIDAASKIAVDKDGKPTKDAMNAVLVEQGRAKKNIFEVENLSDAASAVVRAFKKGGGK